MYYGHCMVYALSMLANTLISGYGKIPLINCSTSLLHINLLQTWSCLMECCKYEICLAGNSSTISCVIDFIIITVLQALCKS